MITGFIGSAWVIANAGTPANPCVQATRLGSRVITPTTHYIKA
jgi:hypothetical protein